MSRAVVLLWARARRADRDAKGSVGSGGGYLEEYGNAGAGFRLIRVLLLDAIVASACVTTCGTGTGIVSVESRR